MRNKASIFIVIVVAISIAIPSTGHAWGHWGWYGAGAFTGGVLLGAAVARPWYYAPAPIYVYPTPPVVYAAPPVYAVQPPAYAPGQAYAYPNPSYAPQAQSQVPVPPRAEGAGPAGQWVDVPAQSVSGKWVPAHRAWVPANP